MDIEKYKEAMPRCKDCTGLGWGECKTAGENDVACEDFERKPPELIDRQAAIATLNEMQDKAATGIEDVTLYRAIKVLRDMPTIEAEPVRHGHLSRTNGRRC